LLALAAPINANSLFKVKYICAKVFFEISLEEALKRLGLTKNT